MPRKEPCVFSGVEWSQQIVCQFACLSWIVLFKLVNRTLFEKKSKCFTEPLYANQAKVVLMGAQVLPVSLYPSAPRNPPVDAWELQGPEEHRTGTAGIAYAPGYFLHQVDQACSLSACVWHIGDSLQKNWGRGEEGGAVVSLGMKSLGGVCPWSF